ncbi:hypothetical protein AcW1_005104 [Taiwanofungus camphoratus]|nr:hypothetical protein AcW1_005159 [Antrodia cinnamomea]KAI0960624.1 hypothetical protein AcW1_005092 [Antrodia cinnamomea]KAI0960638.1 hypothetical protein AcW1_005104 [Antrodia cinnamomea]
MIARKRSSSAYSAVKLTCLNAPSIGHRSVHPPPPRPMSTHCEPSGGTVSFSTQSSPAFIVIVAMVVPFAALMSLLTVSCAEHGRESCVLPLQFETPYAVDNPVLG